MCRSVYLSTCLFICLPLSPLVTSLLVLDRHMVLWYTHNIRSQMLEEEAGEELNRIGLTVHHGMFKTAKTELWLVKSKADIYNSKITNSKSLLKVVATLLHCKSPVLPSQTSKQSLANDFSEYFETKTDVIWSGIGPHVETDPDIEDGCPASLCSFTPLSEDDVSKLIVSLSSATCDNDPILTSLVRVSWCDVADCH